MKKFPKPGFYEAINTVGRFKFHEVLYLTGTNKGNKSYRVFTDTTNNREDTTKKWTSLSATYIPTLKEIDHYKYSTELPEGIPPLRATKNES